MDGTASLDVLSDPALGARGQTIAALLADETLSTPQRWQQIAAQLRPADPFSIHQALFQAVYADWDADQGPPPAWIPDGQTPTPQITALLGDRSFAEGHRWSVEEPEAYWSAILTALQIHFNTPPSSILSVEDGVEQARWLPGARLNIAESCFRGRRADVPALIWRREGDETLGRMTIDALHQRSRTVAGALAALGHKPGQAFAIDMPMTVESVVIYLGIVLFGGVVVSIADSFAPAEIATRIRISDTVLIFTQDVIVRGERRLPLYSRVLAADGPRAVVLPAEATLSVQLREGDVSWTTFLSQGRSALLSPHISDASATTNILFSSGTTGDPKAIPWTQVTPIKAAADAFAHHDVQPGDVVAWPTNLGWMMGPWLIYASLLNGATIALYQGAPTGRGFCTFVQDAKVNVLGVVPSIVRAWRATDATQGLDWSSVRTFSSTGEVSNPDDMLWLMSRAGYSPIIEYCGGTELGGGYIAGSRMQPQAPSTFSSPTMGCAFTILSGDGAATDDGEIALIPPILGSSQRLLNRDHHQVYFANMPTGPHEQPLRRHGDQIRHIGGGYYRALGRVDDTMNLGGIKTSSAEIERACETVAGLHDVAAIAVPPPGGGPERLVLVAVAEPGRELDAEAVRLQAQQAIRAALNPLFKVAAVRFVDALPRTASNKVMRRILRRDVMATGEG